MLSSASLVLRVAKLITHLQYPVQMHIEAETISSGRVLMIKLGLNENYYTPESYQSLYNSIWYKLVELMDLSSIYHKHSPQLNPLHTHNTAKTSRHQPIIIDEIPINTLIIYCYNIQRKVAIPCWAWRAWCWGSPFAPSRVEGWGFRVEGFGLRIQGWGIRVWG